jgi:hypothetical protein
MSRREQLIDLLVARTTATRERLQRESTDDLEKALDKSLLAGIRKEALNTPEVIKRQQEIDEINESRRHQREEFQLSLIFRTPVNGKVAIDNEASRNIIRSWLDETQGDTAISVQWFLKLLKETPSLARSLSWQSADVLDPAKRRLTEQHQEAEDRETFNVFARENGFSEVEANFELAKSVLGEGFDRYTLAQAVQSNALSLAQASQAELEQFRQEAAEERQDYLVNQASPYELRQAARNESEQRRAQAQQQHVAQQIKTREQAEAVLGLPVLPETNADGVRLDAMFFKRLANTDIKKYKQFCSHYGFAAITARLNGVR